MRLGTTLAAITLYSITQFAAADVWKSNMTSEPQDNSHCKHGIPHVSSEPVIDWDGDGTLDEFTISTYKILPGCPSGFSHNSYGVLELKLSKKGTVTFEMSGEYPFELGRTKKGDLYFKDDGYEREVLLNIFED